MQQHFVGTQILGYNIIGVDSDDSQTEEQMEVVGQVVGPAGFPHSNRNRLGEFSFKTSVCIFLN